MKNARFRKYLDLRKNGPADPIDDKAGVAESSDQHIDQDFKGFPHGQASEELINPKSGTEKKTAATQVKDGEKKTGSSRKKAVTDSSDSDDGSGGAFDATETVKE